MSDGVEIEFEARRVEGLRSLTFFAGGRPYLLSRERERDAVQLVSHILRFIGNNILTRCKGQEEELN